MLILCNMSFVQIQNGYFKHKSITIGNPDDYIIRETKPRYNI